MIRIICDNCGRTLVENEKALIDWREIRTEIRRGDVMQYKVHHLCAEPCVENFKNYLKVFMSE